MVIYIIKKQRERQLQEHKDEVDKLKEAAKRREKEDEMAWRRSNKEMPYNLRIVARSKQCQIGDGQFV